MSALQNAIWDVEKAEGDVDFSGVAAYAARAQAYAAIAQAEALTKIVKLLEMIAPPLQGIYAPDATGYHTEDEFNEALDDYKYRKAQAEAWAKAERGQ